MLSGLVFSDSKVINSLHILLVKELLKYAVRELFQKHLWSAYERERVLLLWSYL